MNVPSFPRSISALSLGLALSMTAPIVLAQDPQVPQVAPTAAAPTSQQLSPGAVNALQQNIGQQAAPVAPVAQPQSLPASPSSVSIPDVSNESTLLREVAKSQAQLSLLNIFAKIDKARLDMERERMKFEQEKQDAKAAAAPTAPVSGPALGSTGSAPSSASSAAIAQFDEPKPSVRSIYSFDGKTFADVVVDGTKVVATPGSVLFNGDRVVSISSNTVVLSRKGRQMKLPVESGSSFGGASSSASSPASAPAGLPPIPPGSR